ncbi:MAG: NADPH-dependent 2,4-dienoyl-CoA reductase [Pseudolabrys sp.]|nr:NADPH-dependent 2,4-dienoyl-CoA reductase [Pseudolabrys sp.]
MKRGARGSTAPGRFTSEGGPAVHSSAPQQQTPYPHLFSPIRIGTHDLKNRIVMGSMHTRLEHLDRPLERQVAFYTARAKGGVALIISGGHAPNSAGLMEPGAPILNDRAELYTHRAITEAVHANGAKMLLQIIHAGRNARQKALVGASAIKSPIYPFTPRALTSAEVESTIDDFVRCAELATEGGYDGIEIMGSEGYLINQFTVPRTNDRTDRWGGSLENRLRFPTEIVQRIRCSRGRDFIIMFRISALDLVEGGATADEIDALAQAVEAAGADVLNTGIGWHESAVPTIAYPVPRAAWGFATKRLKNVVKIPVIASNRINTPEVAEDLIATGDADLVSMARPMLADPQFAAKARDGCRDDINVCIACNQACLDYIFTTRVATCLVNPKAGREIEFNNDAPNRLLRLAVVGSGPAGMAAAINAACRGHTVTLFEADASTGGQLNLASRVPGKSEFKELIRYFNRQLVTSGVTVRTGTRASAQQLKADGFDHVVVATGVKPRVPLIDGINHRKVVMYNDLLMGRANAGSAVAIIGAGGIGYDIAEYLTAGSEEQNSETFLAEWGVDSTIRLAGGLGHRTDADRSRSVTLLQRSEGRMGERLGRTTGWILRSQLKRRGLRTIAGCQYISIGDEGLTILADGKTQTIAADTIIICAGQDSNRELADELAGTGVSFDVIGGADYAAELDALRAIDQGTRLAYRL